MRITLIEASNFKSFDTVSIDHLKNINLLFGYNNSGKSNLLQLLHLIFKRKAGGGIVNVEQADGTMKPVSRYREGVTNFWDGDILESRFIFTNNNYDKKIKLKVEIEEIRRNNIPFQEALNLALLSKEKYLVSNEDTPDKILITLEISDKTKDVSKMELIEAKINDHSIFKKSTPKPLFFKDAKNPALRYNESAFQSLLGYFNDCVLFLDSNRYFANGKIAGDIDKMSPVNFKDLLFSRHMNVESYKSIVAFQNFLKSFNMADQGKLKLRRNIRYNPLINSPFSFSDFNNVIELMFDKNSERFPILNFGTGLQQIFYILARIFFSDSKIIAIEELELNLSPRYQEEVLNYLNSLISNKKISQVFFTTHSYYFGRLSNGLKYGFYDVYLDDNGYSKFQYINRSNGRTQYLMDY
ncbi:AAA family ATPase [Dolichospermum sp. ST_sed3]|nr:AAA family ATPase [Dolichospermum sp. ST_sed3]